jgi:glucose-1-phosphate adenylyltransferase
VPPQMRRGERWYAGTADAIHQNLYLLERSGAKYVVILSGDHIYRMDYAPMLQFHTQQNAGVTVACMQVPIAEASAFGILQVDRDQRIRAFQEKPTAPAAMPGAPDQALASMGIYVFSLELLTEALKADHADPDSSHDFGKDILPGLITRQAVHAYPFGGEEGRVTPDRYWRDVGTLDALYEANMDLLLPVPPLDLYQDDWAIRTYAPQRPPARTVPGTSGDEGIFINSIVAGGTVIAGGSVQHSVLFSKVYVGDEAMVEDSLLFDGVHVGDGASLRHCIVDKDVDIPTGERIGHDPDQDRARFTMSEKGVVVVPKGYRFD